jgi:hypothetical protein
LRFLVKPALTNKPCMYVCMNVNLHMKSQFNVLQHPHAFLSAGLTLAILALTGILCVSRPGS